MADSDEERQPVAGEPEGESAPAGGMPAEPETHAHADGQDEASGFEEPPLARVRYGLAKELRLYPDMLVNEYLEEHEETRFALDSIQRIILTPGEYNPSKLVLLVDLDDGTRVIVAEGMTNARDFRAMLAHLRELRPQIELDPPDLEEQLTQAISNRRGCQLGCYGLIASVILVIIVVYAIVAAISPHPH
ncbi:MAG TPA: hypothetical protein VF807_08245 [Ktedonobacterales bacterium]